MSGHGFRDPIWLGKMIVANAHPILLKKAVMAAFDHLEDSGPSGTSPFEIIDRIVQVAATGEYKAPVDDGITASKVITLQDGKLTPEQEQEIQDFIRGLDGIPTAEKTDDDMPYEEWLKKMGIPTEGDEESEDDDQE